MTVTLDQVQAVLEDLNEVEAALTSQLQQLRDSLNRLQERVEEQAQTEADATELRLVQRDLNLLQVVT